MEACNTFIKEHLRSGKIRKSQLLQAFPFFFVQKKDRGLCPCQDYQYLNEYTVKNTYLLPLISTLIDKLKGAKYFSKVDIQWGYNNICIKEGDEWKATFTTPFGLYEPLVMFFGQCDSPPTFQAFMDSTFGDMMGSGVSGMTMGLLLAPDSTTTSSPLGSVICPEPTPGVPCWLILLLPR